MAEGSGRSVDQVQELLGVFVAMRAQMATMSRMMAISGGMKGE